MMINPLIQVYINMGEQVKQIYMMSKNKYKIQI